jgi:outer membrane protein OmpA-like peptidoglycan-associated protein
MINTHYDERAPFLTRNGLTLFYASNHMGSMGGHDIFHTTFDPEKKNWAFPENLGFPVNSAGNESSLIVSPDGMTAYLTSDRKEGYGQEDVYRVFFKQPLLAHQEISVLPTFLQFLQTQDLKTTTNPGPKPVIEVKEYFISHLFFPENEEVLNQQNVRKLDVVVNLMLIYPKITVEFSCFDLPDRQRTFSVYFAIKKAEEVAAYLVKKGVARNRILLKGYGSSFALASLPAGMKDHPLYQRLNQRMEITLHHYKSEPVIIHMENIQVPENMKMDQGNKFTSLRHGFYYSIQLDSVQQILQNSALESLEELFIEVDNTTGHYLYLAGFITTFEEAQALRKSMIGEGFPDAVVVPYINGLRLRRSEIEMHANTYPDLLDYLQSFKN